MKTKLSRRRILGRLGALMAGVSALPVIRQAKAVVQQALASGDAPKGYDPTQHKWLMAIDVDRCIGCGNCVEACKKENGVPPEPHFFRTWIERYVIMRPAKGEEESRGEVRVYSPNGGMRNPTHEGARAPDPELPPTEDILHSFFVPKLCNLCKHSPCSQVCPVGATFDAPDGAVLVDPKYCIGCGFCIQACPYGCRFFNPITRVAEKCSLCYHRITRGLRPACVEVCPTEARVFGDLKQAAAEDPIRRFFETHRVQTLKPHLGTEPRVVYAGLDKEAN